jgi:DNA adenine methylase
MAPSSTTYRKKWRSGETTVIRVPKLFSERLLDIARQWDANDSDIVREDEYRLEPMQGDRKEVKCDVHRPVNVSSVPQRSPFRYPGGKTWLVPYIRRWLKSYSKRPTRLVEPFGGGAVVSLTAAFESLAGQVLFSEMDGGVAAVWKVVLNGRAEWLAREIEKFELNEKNVKAVLGRTPTTIPELAFQTLLRNRVQRGGIMAVGAGLVKTGEGNRGLAARWYPQTLARRIREINLQKERLVFTQGDGLALVGEHAEDPDTVFYVDPPYTLAAKRLYTCWQVDHEALFAQMQRVRGDFLMSYDNTAEVQELARRFGFATRPIAMKNTHHQEMTELLIGRNLDWLDESSNGG